MEHLPLTRAHACGLPIRAKGGSGNTMLHHSTGFAGGEVLRQLLADPAIELVTVLGRRPVGFAHPRLSDCVVESFLDYSKVGKALEADAFIWCLGVSQAAVSREKYIEITLEYTLAAARAAWAQSPGLRFCFLSGPRGGSRRGGALALRKDQGSHRV